MLLFTRCANSSLMIRCVSRECGQNGLVAIPDVAEFAGRHRAGDTAYFNGKAWDRIVFGLDVVLKSAFAAAAVGAVARNTGYQVCQRLGLFCRGFLRRTAELFHVMLPCCRSFLFYIVGDFRPRHLKLSMSRRWASSALYSRRMFLSSWPVSPLFSSL